MKVQNPIIGRARGSAGGMTFCKNYDKNVARAKAFEVANPKTEAQTTQRNYFKELTALVATFTEEQLRFLFPNKPKAMSRRNALAKQLAEYNTVAGAVKSVDYASIDTIGNASTLNDFEATATVEGQIIVVELTNTNSVPNEMQNNYFVAMIINQTKREIMLSQNGGQVSKPSFNVPIPSNWEDGDTYSAVPLLINSVSSIVDFGTMYVVKRPAKANA